jgi:deoxyribodipyrimidine photo-lyase
MLSPWVRLRWLPEWAICQQVLEQHSYAQAAKYIDEVCWRTYWKGWLEGRPEVWSNYLDELDADRAACGGNEPYLQVIRAETGIDCLDAWTRELTETGYLHNHARMWYASIWVHTLRLPWTLGAAFFLEHLLDGDAASNTLSWRWVAGLHTQGKSYLASRGNIQKYTAQNFQVDADLASEPLDIRDFAPKPPHQPIQPLPDLPQSRRIGLLVHDDDLSATDWLGRQVPVVSIAGLFPESAYTAHGISRRVVDFRQQCLHSALPEDSSVYNTVAAVRDWAQAEGLQHIIMAQPFVGFWDAITPELSRSLEATGVTLTSARHWWDRHFFPQAKAGFFRFKKAIPAALDQLQKEENHAD